MLFADAQLVWEAHVKGQRNTGERLARPPKSYYTDAQRKQNKEKDAATAWKKKRFIV